MKGNGLHPSCSFFRGQFGAVYSYDCIWVVVHRGFFVGVSSRHDLSPFLIILNTQDVTDSRDNLRGVALSGKDLVHISGIYK